MIKNKKITNEIIGLDIGSYSIKVVSLEKKPEAETILAYNIKKLPPETNSSNIKDSIRETLDEIDLFPDEVNLSLSGPDVIVRFINLPKMRKDQLDDALIYEAEKYIPFNVNEVVLDSIILGEAQNGGQMKVLLAAGKRELIDSRIKLLEELGMGINIMDIAPFAMFNAFIRSHELSKEKVCAFLNIGHLQTDVLVFSEGIPCFMRQIQVGGKNITEVLSKELSLSEEEAEKCKINPEKSNEKNILKGIKLVFAELINEIQLSFGYFENRYNKKVGKIYCSGGTVSQNDTIALFGEELGMDVKRWDPIGQIKLADTISEEDIASVSAQLAVAIGLALRG